MASGNSEVFLGSQGQSITVDFAGPVQVRGLWADLARWILTIYAWGLVANALVVSTHCRWSWDCMSSQWYHYLPPIFPLDVLYRWFARGVRRTASAILPEQCSAWQRVFLGAGYCDRLARVREAVERQRTQSSSLTQRVLNRCSE